MFFPGIPFCFGYSGVDQTIHIRPDGKQFCVSCFERLRKYRIGRSGDFFCLERKFQLKGGICQLMYLKPGNTSAVKMCLKCIFGAKSAKKKKNFLHKKFKVGPLLKGQSGNRKHKIYFIRPNQLCAYI